MFDTLLSKNYLVKYPDAMLLFTDTFFTHMVDVTEYPNDPTEETKQYKATFTDALRTIARVEAGLEVGEVFVFEEWGDA